jgi:hypothetical protein
MALLWYPGKKRVHFLTNHRLTNVKRFKTNKGDIDKNIQVLFTMYYKYTYEEIQYAVANYVDYGNMTILTKICPGYYVFLFQSVMSFENNTAT